ncbi:hypothetical protein WA158_002364 [Blastocystis sp. Blastoise]
MKAISILLIALFALLANSQEATIIKQGETAQFATSATTASCTLNGVEVTEKLGISNDDGTTLSITFPISSEIPFSCTIEGTARTVVVLPTCGDGSVLYQTLMDEDRCPTNLGGKSQEQICVYDPILLKARYITRNYNCHSSEGISSVEQGHAYVHVSVSMAKTGDVNAVVDATDMPSWMRDLITDAFQQVLPVPVKNVYIESLTYSSETKSTLLDLVVDTAFEYGEDMSLVFQETYRNNIVDVKAEVNSYLAASLPSYFSDITLDWNALNVEKMGNPQVCSELLEEGADVAGVTFDVTDSTEDQSVETTVDSLTWAETPIWYYATNDVPSDITNAHPFYGKFTRYCKPLYYGAEFQPTNVLSAVQTDIDDVTSIFFKLQFENMDPRSVITETRLALSRAITRYILNQDDTIPYETFDVYVYYFEGAEKKEASELLYRDTVFYVQVRVRSGSTTQLMNIKKDVGAAIWGECDAYDTCSITNQINRRIVTWLTEYFGPDFNPIDNKKWVHMSLYEDKISKSASARRLRA